MKLILLNDEITMKRGFQVFIDKFIEEYPYYNKWIDENIQEFYSFKRKMYEIVVEEQIVGYVMINSVIDKYSKVNGIFIYDEFQNNGYATKSLKYVLDLLNEENYKYVFIQTRTTNNTVIHLFDKLNFIIVGNKIHNVEQKNNVVAVYDLTNINDVKDMKEVASNIYSGFSN